MKFEDIITLFFVVVISVLLGCQYSNNKHKRKFKYTCGVEGGCEMTLNGTYDSLEECQNSCGGYIF